MAHMYAWARGWRLADGPDEVHRRTVGRLELKADPWWSKQAADGPEAKR